MAATKETETPVKDALDELEEQLAEQEERLEEVLSEVAVQASSNKGLIVFLAVGTFAAGLALGVFARKQSEKSKPDLKLVKNEPEKDEDDQQDKDA